MLSHGWMGSNKLATIKKIIMVPNDAHLSKVFLVQIVAGLLLKLFGRKLFKTYIT